MPEPMNRRTGWWCSPRRRRRVGELAQHRPGVGGDRDAVAAHLVPERRRVEVAREREARAAGDRAADAHQQARRVVERGHRVDGVGVGERRRRRGRERRERPAPVGDPVGARALALAGEQDEGEVAGAARVRAGTRRAARPRSGSIRSMSMTPAAEVAVLPAAAEHEDLGGRRPRARAAGELGVGDDPRHLAELGLAGDRRRRAAAARATAPSRLSAATTERRSGGCPSARRRARPGGRRARSGRGRRCRSGA